MIKFWHPLSSRTLFVLREGVWPRGTVAGACITCLYVLANLWNGTFDSGFVRTALLVVLCFVEWTVVAGLVIGSILWTKRDQATRRGSPHSQ